MMQCGMSDAETRPGQPRTDGSVERPGTFARGRPCKRMTASLLLVPVGPAIAFVFAPDTVESMCPAFGMLTLLVFAWVALSHIERTCRAELRMARRYWQVVARVAARWRAAQSVDAATCGAAYAEVRTAE